MQCVRVVQLNCVKVQCMLCEWECDVGELFVTVHLPDCLREKAVPQSASAGSDATETSP